MGIILLTSAGFLNPRIFQFVKDKVKEFSLSRAAIITTAAENKEKNKYSQLAHQQLLDTGYKNVDFFDLETQDSSLLSVYDTFYVCGGNTFKLQKFANISNFKDVVTSLINKRGLYVGVSAGSLIMGPSIEIANEVVPDSNEVELHDFTALNLSELIISPHYEEVHEVEIKAFENKHNVKATRLTNNQAVLIENGKTSIIE